MALRAGRILRGSTGTYKVLKAIKPPTVYKAEVLSGSHLNAGCAVVLKTAQTELERVALRREYQRYQIPGIASSQFIRVLYDSVGSFVVGGCPPCLVFEWMDTDLRSVPSRLSCGGSSLPKVVSKSVLSALEVFRREKVVHTDVNINNILLSNIDSPSPVVKLADLRMLIQEGYSSQRLQSLPCRAPEVWQGVGCFHASDVWSLGVTLARWLHGKPLFGANDKIIEGNTEAWCIAKLLKLVGPLGPCVDRQPYKDEFELAGQLGVMEFPEVGKLIKVGTWREELERIVDPGVSRELLDFIEYLLVADMERRPTAADALGHPYVCS